MLTLEKRESLKYILNSTEIRKKRMKIDSELYFVLNAMLLRIPRRFHVLVSCRKTNYFVLYMESHKPLNSYNNLEAEE